MDPIKKLSVLLIFYIFPQSGYNTRVKAVHIVNARPWTESVITMIKLLLKKKIAGRVSIPAYFLSFSTQNLVTQYIYVSIYKHNLVVFLAN
jgi:hypothetical protein